MTITDTNKQVDVTLPPEGVNSTLTVSGSDTPAIVVGGLDAEATALKTSDVEKVTVNMTVEEKPEASMEAAAVTAIKDAAKATPVLEYLDVSVKATITKTDGTTTKVLDNTKNVMTLVVPFDFKGKNENTIKVYRYHDSTAAVLNKGKDANGEGYELDKNSSLIYIYAKQFSTYAIGYTAEFKITFDANGGTGGGDVTTQANGTVTLPADPSRDGYTFQGWYTDKGEKVSTSTVFKADTTVKARWTQNGGGSSGSGSGGGGGWIAPSKPTVTIDGDKTGGKVEASQNSVTITPEDGYQVSKITVNGKEVNIPADNKLTGLKSTDKVVVTFEKIPDPATIPVFQRFTDVPAGAWYEDAVQFVVDKGLFYGTGPNAFEPESPMTRAMLATVLWRHQGCGVVNYAMNYGDVAQGEWYSEAIRWAASEGVVGGYGNGLFGPNDNITREQLAVMLWRYAGSPAATNKELHFADADQTSDWAMEAMRWAVENGIINGYNDGRLAPQEQATRAQVAAMLMRYLKEE